VFESMATVVVGVAVTAIVAIEEGIDDQTIVVSMRVMPSKTARRCVTDKNV